MVRLLLLAACFCVSNVWSQDVEAGERQGLLEVSASIYPTFSMNYKSNMNFVGGHMAYQLDDKYSFRGDILAMTSTQSGKAIYNDYFLIETGVVRNISVKRFDFFLGLEFGMAGIQLYRDNNSLILNAPPLYRYYQPVWDAMLGFKFHVSPYFYFYGETKFLNNRNPEANSLQSNLAVTGGLGLQLPTKKFIDANKEAKHKRKNRYI